MKKISSQVVNYLFLLIILFVGFWSVLYFKRDRSLQIFSAFLMSVGYVFWGVIHQFVLKKNRLKIVIEYVVFAAIVFAIVSILILRS